MRSPALAALGVLLMATAAALGAILVHDGEVAGEPDLARAAPGESIRLKGEPEPFSPGASLRPWRAVLPLLGNHTYALADPDAGAVALLTSDGPAPPGVVVAEGRVGLVAPHPDGSGRLLVVVEVRDWQQPILFR